jgi:hypothetical protein
MHKRRYTARRLAERTALAGFHEVKLGYALSLLFPLALGRLLRRGPGDTDEPQAQVKPLPAWLNHALIRFQRLETALFRRVGLPWGLSVVAVVQKRG